MEQSAANWRVKQDATNDEAYAILAQDRVWNSFALADLEPPLRAYSQFAVAYRGAGPARAICLILRHPIIGEVISPFGESAGIDAILQQVKLPEHPLIQAQEVHSPLLQRYYQPETAWRSLFRMATTSASWQPPERVSPQPIRQLGDAELPALEDFYAYYAGVPFSGELFSQGLFLGAYEGKRIIAAGGTHALAPAHRLAVLGHIFTAPQARCQGYATAITAALTTTLVERHFSLVVLNVFTDNENALRIYQRLGFQTHYRLVTGKALLLKK